MLGTPKSINAPPLHAVTVIHHTADRNICIEFGFCANNASNQQQSKMHLIQIIVVSIAHTHSAPINMLQSCMQIKHYAFGMHTSSLQNLRIANCAKFADFNTHTNTSECAC